MDLSEAKQILKNNGFILEDTETNDDEYFELDHMSDEDMTDADWKRYSELYDKHDSIKDKINWAKKFNNPKIYTVTDVENYLYHQLQFEEEEVDEIVTNNIKLIKKLLAVGKKPSDIADEIKYTFSVACDL